MATVLVCNWIALFSLYNEIKKQADLSLLSSVFKQINQGRQKMFE